MPKNLSFSFIFPSLLVKSKLTLSKTVTPVYCSCSLTTVNTILVFSYLQYIVYQTILRTSLNFDFLQSIPKVLQATGFLQNTHLDVFHITAFLIKHEWFWLFFLLPHKGSLCVGVQ